MGLIGIPMMDIDHTFYHMKNIRDRELKEKWFDHIVVDLAKCSYYLEHKSKYPFWSILLGLEKI